MALPLVGASPARGGGAAKELPGTGVGPGAVRWRRRQEAAVRIASRIGLNRDWPFRSFDKTSSASRSACEGI